VAKKAISENRESDQSVARLGSANFGLRIGDTCGENCSKQKPRHQCRGLRFLILARHGLDTEVHASHAAAGGMPAAGAFFFGNSAIIASVLIRTAAAMRPIYRP
jgi:hypothetical protein